MPGQASFEFPVFLIHSVRRNQNKLFYNLRIARKYLPLLIKRPLLYKTDSIPSLFPMGPNFVEHFQSESRPSGSLVFPGSLSVDILALQRENRRK